MKKLSFEKNKSILALCAASIASLFIFIKACSNFLKRINKPENNALIEHIKNSPIVQAAITESVHRFYYDRILSEKEQDKIDLEETGAADVLSTLWNLQPNWRYIIEKTAKRYTSANTQSVPIGEKPKTIKGIKIEIELI